MSPDADEPDVPADDAPDGAVVRRPPGPGDRPIANLPPPASAAEQADEVDEMIESLRLESEAAGSDAPPATDLVDVEEVDDDPFDEDPTLDDELEPEPDDEEEELLDPEPEPDRESEAVLEQDAEPEVEEPVDPFVESAPALERDPEPVVDAPADEAHQAERVEDAEMAVPAPPAPTRSRRARLAVAALVVAGAATAFAGVRTRQAEDLRTERNDRRDIEMVAGRFGAAYLSYDFAHVEASGRAVTALATADFGRSYAADRAPGIQQLFTSRQTTTEADTTEVFLGSITSRTARALVVVDVTATSPTEGEQKLDDVSFVLDLTRTRLGWRVAKVARPPQPSLDQGAEAPTP